MAILNRFDTATFEEEQEEAPDAYRGDLNPWTENGERSDFDLPARASGHGYEGGGRGTELSLPFPPVPGSRYYCPGGGGEEVMSAREVYRGHDFNERSPRRPGGMLVRGGRARRRGWSMGVGSASGSKV